MQQQHKMIVLLKITLHMMEFKNKDNVSMLNSSCELLNLLSYSTKYIIIFCSHFVWRVQAVAYQQLYLGSLIYTRYLWRIMIKTTFILALLICSALSAQRYADEDMMKKHHNEQYPKNGPNITVHLIPHSHDDVGWLKTVDNYYYGSDQRTQFAGVQYIIDTVVTQLADHPEYKFTIVEMAFLYRWWNQATDKQRETMRRLVANKQLHFMNAGWSMSDEANMYYEDFIDQMTVGLRWLKDTLNYVPDVAWHIDPFGHHSASASLFSQLGFNSFFFARIDYQDKEVRLNNKSMQMIWRPFQYNGDKSTYIFTHVNYYHYSSPPGFCFDNVCRDEPIKDDPTLQDYNIQAKAKQFVEYFKSQALHYRTTNLMHTLGQDFQYTNAHMFYKNVDKLVKYINSRPQFGATMVFSTPTDYIAAIQKQKATYPVKTDDFFPYADGEHAFWTGYFTSRVALKGFVRDLSRFTQAIRKHISQLKISNTSDTIRNNPKQIEQIIFGIEMALGILQHHDAVAGTAKQKVTDDYVATGLKSIAAFSKLYNDIKKEEINKETGETVNEDLYFNLFWNQTGTATGFSQKLNDGKNVLVSLYNPGSKGTYLIRLRVPPSELNIVDQTNKPIVGDVICANLKDSNDCEVLFYLDFEQSSNAYIKLSAVASGGSAKKVEVKELTVAQQIKEFTLGNDKLKFTRGNQSFDLTLNGAVESFKLFYNYYEGWDSGGQHSGAYIFRPKSDSPKPYSNIAKMHYADGVTHGIIILQGDRTTTRAYFSKVANEVRNNGVLVETQLEPIPINDNIGKEVTFNIKTNYKNGKTFYTDSMGLEQQKRVLDFRPTWDYKVWQPTAGNYYPMNSFINLRDEIAKKQVTILNDRSQGAAVIREGEVQIMIHRRLLVDDGRGVGQPLNETDGDKQGLRQIFRHYIVFGNNYRNVQKMNDQRILPTFGVVSSNKFSTVNIRKAPICVPASVKLYLRPFEDGSYLIRFHNTNPTQQATVTLGDQWKGIEYTLAANQLKSDWKSKQLSWNEQKQATPSLMNRIAEYFQDLSIVKKDQQSNLRIDGATTIDLQIFELRAFKLSRA